MATQINTRDCTSALKGTGLISCPIRPGRLIGFLKVPKSFRFNTESEDLDSNYINTSLLNGTFVPFNNSSDFTQDLQGNTFKTYNSGVDVKVKDGLTKLTFIFNNEYGFHAAAFSHNTYNTHDVALVYDNDLIAFATLADGVTLKGITTGIIDTETIKWSDGSEPQETMVSFQITSANEYNNRLSFVDVSQFGVTSKDINGVIDTTITVIGALAPADQEIVVSVTASANTSIPIVGIGATDVNDFQVTGQTVSAVVYDATNATYTLTTDELVVGAKTVSLGSGSNIAVNVAGDNYSGASSIFTV